MYTNLDCDTIARFWAKVRRGRPSECWPWLACVDRSGVGYIRLSSEGPARRMGRANRVAWVLTHGQIPPGLDVLRRCGTSGCTNVRHLYLAARNSGRTDNRKRIITAVFTQLIAFYRSLADSYAGR
jgi:hypothetical protein